jgi:hypothetical protein
VKKLPTDLIAVDLRDAAIDMDSGVPGIFGQLAKVCSELAGLRVVMSGIHISRPDYESLQAIALSLPAATTNPVEAMKSFKAQGPWVLPPLPPGRALVRLRQKSRRITPAK